MEELIEQLPQDDWVDQDLLTRDLARDLLDAEIAAEQRRLENPDEDAGNLLSPADRQRRIDAMIAVRERQLLPNSFEQKPESENPA